MKFLVLVAFAVCVAMVAAGPVDPPSILRSSHDIKEDGSFNWVSETSDGTIINQRGYVKNPQEQDPEKRIIVLEGDYTYVAKDGQIIKTAYVADENGYQPTGAHLPTV